MTGQGWPMRAAIGAAVFTTIGVAPAAAQFKPEKATGSLIPVKPQAVPKREAGEIKKQFAACVYRRQPARIRTFLEQTDAVTVPKSALHAKDIATAFGMGNCLGETMTDNQLTLGMKTSPASIRAMMVEQDYLYLHRRAPALPAGASETVTRTFISTGPALAEAQTLATFADCTVFKDVAHADALLRTTPGSEQERAAARTMGPALGACLVQGQSMSLSAANVRSFVADAMWARFDQPGVPLATILAAKDD